MNALVNFICVVCWFSSASRNFFIFHISKAFFPVIFANFFTHSEIISRQKITIHISFMKQKKSIFEFQWNEIEKVLFSCSLFFLQKKSHLKLSSNNCCLFWIENETKTTRKRNMKKRINKRREMCMLECQARQKFRRHSIRKLFFSMSHKSNWVFPSGTDDRSLQAHATHRVQIQWIFFPSSLNRHFLFFPLSLCSNKSNRKAFYVDIHKIQIYEGVNAASRSNVQ